MKTHTVTSKDSTATTRMGQYVKAPAVQRSTPPVRAKGARDWAVVDLRAVASGDVFRVIGGVGHLRELAVRDSSGSGKPKVNPELLTILTIIGVVLGLSTRRLEGYARGLFRWAGIDPDLAPDHSTLARFKKNTDYEQVKHLVYRSMRTTHPVLYVAIDATGISVTKAGGWVVDKPGSTDHRRGRYVKLHVATDIQTGEIVCWQLTGSTGAGSGDVSVGPGLVEALPDTVQTVCADGAYTSAGMFEAADVAGVTLLVPLPGNAVYGAHPSRDVLLTQQSRIGRDEWKRRSGYHQRSQVESSFATMDRTLGNRVRTHLPEHQEAEMGVKITWHNYARNAAR